MRINNNISALNTYNKYTKNVSTASKSMEKLSSGYRINRAADDAAGLSISQKMRSQIAGLGQAQRNAQDGVSYLQTAEGALSEVSDMLTRMKELSVQKANGTYSTDDTANIDAEMNALGTAMDDILTNTQFNGITVFQTDTTIAYGQDGSQSLTISAAAFTGGLSSGSDTATIEDAITSVNTDRATYGAEQNQLEHVVNNTTTTSENLTAAESRIRDVDMASEMSAYTKNNILVQAATAMLSQANSQPQGVLQLLK
ncbi:MAG: flagellin [Clostridiales bacterium]|nr:flagellin [Clostridiales bacterium]